MYAIIFCIVNFFNQAVIMRYKRLPNLAAIMS